MHQVLQVFLRHPGHLSLLVAPEVQSLGFLEDPCLLEYQKPLDLQGALFLLLLAENPVKEMV